MNNGVRTVLVPTEGSLTTYLIRSRKVVRKLTSSSWLPTGWGQGKSSRNWLGRHDYQPDEVKESGQGTDLVDMTTYRMRSRKVARELTWSSWLPTWWGREKRPGNWLGRLQASQHLHPPLACWLCRQGGWTRRGWSRGWWRGRWW